MKWLLTLLASVAWAVSVPTAQYDNSRIGVNNQEVILTPSNVSGLTKLGDYPVDGTVWGQPLIAQNINGKDLLVVCTMHDSCYGFDANVPGAQIWSKLAFATSRTTSPSNGGNLLYGGEIGCLATPVIDLFAQRLYTLCATNTPSWILYQLNLTTGTILNQVTISGQVPGSGDPTGPVFDTINGGNLVFNPTYSLGRPALTLYNGVVYVAFGSFEDVHPYHGWLFGYSTSNMTQVAVFCTTPNNFGGSVWQSAGGPAIDGTGNLYVATGNGGYDGVTSWGNSILKLNPGLQVVDWFTPSNWATLESQDLDLSSGRPALIPGTSLVVVGAKDYNVYSLSTGCMGHLGGGTCNLQIFKTNPNGQVGIVDGIYMGSVYLGGTAYFPNVAGSIYGFGLIGSTWNTNPIISAQTFAFPGAALTGSSNSGQNGILWAVTTGTSAESGAQAGTLRALNPATYVEFWNATVGTMSKFASPTVANGRIYVSTLNGAVRVYGLPGGGSKGSQLRGGARLRNGGLR